MNKEGAGAEGQMTDAIIDRAMAARVSRGRAAIEAYVDACLERDSYAPQDGEEQTAARKAKHAEARARVWTCLNKLHGPQIAEATQAYKARRGGRNG